MKRQRGRGRKPGGGGGGGGGGNQGNRPFESNGPDVKIRGTAAQIYEKYSQYARDAQSSGDRVKYESYLQHAEHYFRIMAATMPREQRPQPHGEIGMTNSQHQDDQDGDDTSNDALKVVDDGGGEEEGGEGGDADDAEAREEDGAEASGGDDRQEGRGRRRRGRRRNGEGGPPQGNDRPANATGGGDTEARSALDSLARKQGALTGG